ncbi:MAG: SUMF1/EgtB/PvdO family nonheme iron enzyme, partial [Sinobacteraceae bacterium]|nr:SUMF1/EgtB/PvdO family nonheme iron enzyme [Nevskiaceae bacterium]
MTEPPRAVFLSYASQDAACARRIADALREGGLEVWFDQSELRGGDAWDSSIRRQIKSCKLFLAVISNHTQAREEGYFRREWNLAVARTLDMAEDTPFLLPVVIDATGDAEARVPERFREVQWTRLPDGATPAAFVERVRRLAIGRVTESKPASSPAAPQAKAGSPSQIPAAEGPRLANSAQLYSGQRRATRVRYKWLAAAVAALLLVVAALLVVPPWQKKEHARNVLLPDIESRATNMYRSNSLIFDEAMEAERYLRQDPVLARLLPSIVNTLSIDTEPAGAQVFWKDYETPTAPWRPAGTTPLQHVKVPRNYLRLEVRKEGYQTIELAAPMFSLRLGPITQHLKLDPVGRLATNMVRIPRSTTNVQIVGIDKYGPRDVPEFLMDKFEVTNRQFKAFIDARGYNNPAYWSIPIRDGSRVIPLAAALARFRDRTDRPGPATWEAGTYPDGAADQPVTGISWYEAAAYAAFVHKQLPTVFHWAAVADTSRSEFLLPLSNFNHKAPTPVGSLGGFSTFGVYDLAGNAREWTYNQSGDSDQRFILGGGWSDPSYAFNDSFSQPSLDRSDSNGLRCITELSEDATTPGLRQALSMDFR